MNTQSIINAVGGRKKVIEMTGLHKSSISYWTTNNILPVPWLKFFQAKFKKLNWDALMVEPAPVKKEKKESL